MAGEYENKGRENFSRSSTSFIGWERRRREGAIKIPQRIYRRCKYSIGRGGR